MITVLYSVSLTAARWPVWVTIGIERERKNAGIFPPELRLPYGANDELMAMSGSDMMNKGLVLVAGWVSAA